MVIYGHPHTGVTVAAIMVSTMGIGDEMSDTTAVSTTDMDMADQDIMEAGGADITSCIIRQLCM